MPIKNLFLTASARVHLLSNIMEEIEVKFLNIDVPALEAKLTELGATRVFDRMYRRNVYDYPDLSLNAKNSWVRVRDEGDQITMGFKQRTGVTSSDTSTNDGGMDEVEFVISDYDKASLFLEKIGMTLKFYEENRRIRWIKDDVEFDIDYWPEIPPFVEIEAPSWEKIDQTIALLGFNPEDKKIFSNHQIYKSMGIEKHDYISITFKGLIKR